MRGHRPVLGLLTCLLLSGCMTFELGTLYSLSKLKPSDIDPKSGRVAILWPDEFTQNAPPVLEYTATKKDHLPVKGRLRASYDPASSAFIPYDRSKGGDLRVYALDKADQKQGYALQALAQSEVDSKDWVVQSKTTTSFAIEEKAFREYCNGKRKFDISIWVKVNETRRFQRLVDDKTIDKFMRGNIKAECDNPDTTLIYRAK